MILSKSYQKIMEHIEVTDEMRDRILQNLTAEAEKPAKKVVTFPVKRLLSVAACIAMLFVCGTILKPLSHTDSESPDELSSAVVDFVECASAEELSEQSGFTVTDITGLPFEAENTSYTWCWGEFAQIEYTGNADTVLYRKAAGNDDISGDYNEYEQVDTEQIDDVTVTVKGNEGKYYLATWQADGYTYSVSDEQGLELDKFVQMIESLR